MPDGEDEGFHPMTCTTAQAFGPGQMEYQLKEIKTRNEKAQLSKNANDILGHFTAISAGVERLKRCSMTGVPA